MGEFLFSKWIIPQLTKPDENGITINCLLSSNTKNCMKIISTIFKKIYKGIFFNSYTETDYTLFNHYIVEIIPEMNIFFKSLIDVSLPKQIEDLLNKYLTNNLLDNILDPEEINIEYNFFSENSEELVNLHCVCFNVTDILAIWRLFKSEKENFKQDIIFYKSLEKLNYQEIYLCEITKNEFNTKYFLIFDTIYNQEKIKYLSMDKLSYTFTDDIKNNEFVLQRIKFCIKLVLRGLNLINKKVYSLLVDSDTNEKFLEIINKIIQIEEELFEEHLSDKIPLTWYSLFMTNNIKNIPPEFQSDNYNKLYEEIFSEASEQINFLKEKSNILITKYGINMRCAEKLIERSQRDFVVMKKIEKFLRIENFLQKANIEACIRYNKRDNKPCIGGNASDKKNYQDE